MMAVVDLAGVEPMALGDLAARGAVALDDGPRLVNLAVLAPFVALEEQAGILADRVRAELGVRSPPHGSKKTTDQVDPTRCARAPGENAPKTREKRANRGSRVTKKSRPRRMQRAEGADSTETGPNNAYVLMPEVDPCPALG